MTTDILPLNNLARSIAQQQTQLERLRKEYEARQTQLTELTRRREELQAQLRRVDDGIKAVVGGAGAPGKSPVPATPSARPAAGRQTLPALLKEIVDRASGPLNIKQLTEEVHRRHFPTKSKNLGNLVETRVRELVQDGRLARAPNQPIYSVIPVSGKPRAGSPSTSAATRKKPGRKAGPSKQSAHPSSDGKRRRKPLREVLTELLGKSKRPLGGAELARQALATGHKTNSNDFPSVVWAMLAQMDNVEHVSGEGYRLKQQRG